MRGLAVASLVALLLVPTVGARVPWGSGIAVPLPHAGDAYAYARHIEGDTKLAPGDSVFSVKLEGPGTAVDRYGIPRQVITYHEQLRKGDAVAMEDRCHMLERSGQAVRRDVAASPPDYTWSSGEAAVSVAASSTTIDFTPLVSFAPRSCDGYDIWAGQSYAEGDRIHLWAPVLVTGLPEYVSWEASHGAVPTTFHGRDALSFTFDVDDLAANAEGKLTVVLADGLPAIARIVLDATITDTRGTHPTKGTAELTGYVAGNGPVIENDGNTQQPLENPEATFVRPGPLAFDDTNFALPFPYVDALDAAKAQPSSGLAVFLQTHPEALLWAAMYERHSSVANKPKPTQNDGAWILIFAQGPQTHQVTVERASGVGPLGSPVKITTVTQNSFLGTTNGAVPKGPPTRIATSTDLARLAAGEGLRGERIESLDYFTYPVWKNGTGAVLFVSDVPYTYADGPVTKGTQLSLSVLDGSIYAVSTKERRTASVLMDAPVDVAGTSALAALAGPAPGVGLGAAATGILVLLVLTKFLLVPLFTRLRRDRLLDNPVRARLYERVRAEPGIHVAELIDLAGIGEGATRHHLQQLTVHRFLYALEEPGFVRYFAAGDVPPDVARKFAALRGGSMRKVFDAYAEAPDMTLREAARKLEMSAPGVHRCRRKLLQAGLLPQRR